MRRAGCHILLCPVKKLGCRCRKRTRAERGFCQFPNSHPHSFRPPYVTPKCTIPADNTNHRGIQGVVTSGVGSASCARDKTRFPGLRLFCTVTSILYYNQPPPSLFVNYYYKTLSTTPLPHKHTYRMPPLCSNPPSRTCMYKRRPLQRLCSILLPQPAHGTAIRARNPTPNFAGAVVVAAK